MLRQSFPPSPPLNLDSFFFLPSRLTPLPLSPSSLLHPPQLCIPSRNRFPFPLVPGCPDLRRRKAGPQQLPEPDSSYLLYLLYLAAYLTAYLGTGTGTTTHQVPSSRKRKRKNKRKPTARATDDDRTTTTTTDEMLHSSKQTEAPKGDRASQSSPGFVDEEAAPAWDRVSDGSTHDPDSGVKRGLKNRHLSMMALAGIIGPGLLVGAGGALQSGGPASLIIGFGVIGESTIHLIAYILRDGHGSLAWDSVLQVLFCLAGRGALQNFFVPAPLAPLWKSSQEASQWRHARDPQWPQRRSSVRRANGKHSSYEFYANNGPA